MITSTITQKGQVTIPAPIRKALGVKPRDRVTFINHEGEIVIKPAVDFFSLRGSIKTKKPFDIKAIERAAEKYVVEGYTKKHVKAR